VDPVLGVVSFAIMLLMVVSCCLFALVYHRRIGALLGQSHPSVGLNGITLSSATSQPLSAGHVHSGSFPEKPPAALNDMVNTLARELNVSVTPDTTLVKTLDVLCERLNVADNGGLVERARRCWDTVKKGERIVSADGHVHSGSFPEKPPAALNDMVNTLARELNVSVTPDTTLVKKLDVLCERLNVADNGGLVERARRCWDTVKKGERIVSADGSLLSGSALTRQRLARARVHCNVRDGH